MFVLLQYYVTDVGQFDQYLNRFFKGYEAASERLFNRLDTVGNDASGQLSKYIAQVKQQWPSQAHFLTHMASVYKLALAEMLDRLVYKQLLQQLNDQGVSLRDTPAARISVGRPEVDYRHFFGWKRKPTPF